MANKIKLPKFLKLIFSSGVVANSENESDTTSIEGGEIAPSRNGELTDDTIVKLLRTHPLIEELRAWGSFRSKVLDIKDPIKRNMSEYYLNLLFSTLYDEVAKMIEHYNTYLDSSVDLNTILIDALTSVQDEATAHGVPSIFLDKFSAYLYSQSRILADTYSDLDKYECYDSKIEQATFRLDLGILMTRCITSQMESVINGMNGELRAALEGSVFDK